MVGEGQEQESREEPRRDDQQAPGRDDETSEDGGLRGTVESARQAFARSFDRLTGTEFRRQFEEFTGVVTTTVLGVEQSAQEEPSRPPVQKLVRWAFIFSLVAVILGVVAVVRTL